MKLGFSREAGEAQVDLAAGSHWEASLAPGKSQGHLEGSRDSGTPTPWKGKGFPPTTIEFLKYICLHEVFALDFSVESRPSAQGGARKGGAVVGAEPGAGPMGGAWLGGAWGPAWPWGGFDSRFCCFQPGMTPARHLLFFVPSWHFHP